jgi:hypothetical protein
VAKPMSFFRATLDFSFVSVATLDQFRKQKNWDSMVLKDFSTLEIIETMLLH